MGFLRGELADPRAGGPNRCGPRRWPAAAGQTVAEFTADDEAALGQLGRKRQATLNRLLFPGPTKEFESHREI